MTIDFTESASGSAEIASQSSEPQSSEPQSDELTQNGDSHGETTVVSEDRGASLRETIFPLLMVVCWVGFANARSITVAGASAVGAGIMMYILSSQKKRNRKLGSKSSLGKPLMRLGAMAAVGPDRMKVWHVLAVLVFCLLGLVPLLAMEGTDAPVRWGISLVSFSIVGAFLRLLSHAFRKLGPIVMGGGFAAGATMFLWAAQSSWIASQDDSTLQALKCFCIAILLGLSSLQIFASTFGRKSRTPVYECGVHGPYGFVPWSNAEHLEFRYNGEEWTLVVGAYNGWTLWIDVTESNRSCCESLVARKSRLIS